MSDDTITERREYPLGRARTAGVELELTSGSLSVSGGAEPFCVADFEYSHPELRPIDDYELDDDEAELELTQPSVRDLQYARSSWNLAFNSDVQIELAIASMSGSLALDLDQVQVANVDVESKSGSVEASLAGSYPELDEVVFDSKSGRVALSLSGDLPKLSTVEIDNKSGRVDLGITGNCPELNRIAVNSTSGAVAVDLRGSFQRDDLGVRIDATAGSVRVRVPDDVGVSMNASTTVGKVRAMGFSDDSGRLTNAAFGKSTATIWLNVHVTTGSIEVVSG